MNSIKHDTGRPVVLEYVVNQEQTTVTSHSLSPRDIINHIQYQVGISTSETTPPENTANFHVYSGFQLHQMSLSVTKFNSTAKAGQCNVTLVGDRGTQQTREFYVKQGETLKRQWFRSNPKFGDIEVFKPFQVNSTGLENDLVQIDSINCSWTLRLNGTFRPGEFPTTIAHSKGLPAPSSGDIFGTLSVVANDLAQKAGAAITAYLTKALVAAPFLEFAPAPHWREVHGNHLPTLKPLDDIDLDVDLLAAGWSNIPMPSQASSPDQTSEMT